MENSVLEISKEPGVKDLPTRQKGYFALALKWEREAFDENGAVIPGRMEKAQEYLEKALKAEEQALVGAQ